MGTPGARAVAAEQVLRTVYQPVVDLGSGGIAAFDATTTFATRVSLPSAAWFAIAAARGVRVSLDCRAISQAVEALTYFPHPLLLMVTASSTTVCSRRLLGILADTDPERVVIQLAAGDPVHDVEAFHQAAAPLRALGTRFAVDAVGSRIDHMAHVARLRPDIIRLDRSVVEHAAGDGPLAAHARGAVHYAEETDIPVFAEGIDTVAELEALRALGVRFGQGPLLSPPLPLADWRRRFGVWRPAAAA